jgi:diguanylate cyclase (GGDEF)-like protein
MLTDAQWEDAYRSRARSNWAIGLVGIFFIGLLYVPAMALALRLSSGGWRYLVGPAAAVALGAPVVLLMVRFGERQNRRSEEHLRDMSVQLNQAVDRADKEAARRDAQAGRQEFESRLANALDMAEGEPEVLDVIERSLSAVVPGAPAELLLADNSHAHLVRMASVGFDSDHSGCPVDSPTHCPAARRAQVQVFEDSADLDACPKLRQRSEARLSALCVPVSIMGRAVGVLHTTGAPPEVPSEEQRHDMATMAKLAGARIGLLRAMAETELQAATDTLTGLVNRRSFEQRIVDARRGHSTLALIMADLDHFKEMNDTYGHETGDRALRLFSRVLRESFRGEDIVCRYGGEEFAVALPSCPVPDAERALESVRTRLDAALTVSGLPKFTASFGLTEMSGHEDLMAALARADAALFSAKRNGRDRVVSDQGPGASDRLPFPPVTADRSV